jgi:hypothetical protein
MLASRLAQQSKPRCGENLLYDLKPALRAACGRLGRCRPWMTEAHASTGLDGTSSWLRYLLVFLPRLAHTAHKGEPSRGAHDGYPNVVGAARRRAGYFGAAARGACYPTIIGAARRRADRPSAAARGACYPTIAGAATRRPS